MTFGLDIADAHAANIGRTMARAVCMTKMTAIIMTMRPHGPGPSRVS
jgi:hypothetical protein